MPERQPQQPGMQVYKKRKAQRARPPRHDTSSQASTLHQLPAPATRGSLGINVPSAVDITLTTTQVHQIPKGIYGPIYQEDSTIGALLMGRSSTGVAGLVVLPGVIDADYTGEITITCFTLTPPLIIKAGTRLAQLVLLPEMNLGKNTPVARGSQGFGFSGSTLVTLVQQMKTRPIIIVKLTAGREVKTLSMMMDTGADVTIINLNVWPRHWKLITAHNAVQGIGGGSTPLQALKPVQLKFPEGQGVTVHPYVLPLPGQLGGLVGREVMSQLGAVLSIPEPTQPPQHFQ